MAQTADPIELYELRYLLQDPGTRSETFTAADNAAWNAGTAITPRCFDFEHNLTYEEIEDTSAQTAPEGNPAPIPVRRLGTIKWKQWLEGGANSTTATALGSLLGSGAVLGGLRNPTAATDAAEADCTASKIKATGHGMIENELVLVGVAGDSGGDGRVAPIEDASNANEYDLQIALPGAPATSAVLQNGHTIYADRTVEQYIDVLLIGSHAGSGATDNPDQIQCIGCACSSLVFGGLGNGEKPYVEMEFQVSDWQWVNYADQATISHTQAKSGEDPVSSQSGGSFVIQDAGTTTRNAVPCDNVEVEWPINLVMKVDHNYTNSCGGWIRHPAGPPIIRADFYWGDIADMPGLYNDSIAGTAKQVLFQMGRTSAGTVAFYQQRSFLGLLGPDKRTGLDSSTAIKLEFRGDTGRVTDLSSDALKIEDAAMVMGML